MERKTILWMVIGVLFVIALFLVFKAGAGATGNAAAGSSGKLDTTGWTENEIMNYEMHGTIPAKASGGAAASSSSGMVGGC